MDLNLVQMSPTLPTVFPGLVSRLPANVRWRRGSERTCCYGNIINQLQWLCFTAWFFFPEVFYSLLKIYKRCILYRKNILRETAKQCNFKLCLSLVQKKCVQSYAEDKLFWGKFFRNTKNFDRCFNLKHSRIEGTVSASSWEHEEKKKKQSMRLIRRKATKKKKN